MPITRLVNDFIDYFQNPSHFYRNPSKTPLDSFRDSVLADLPAFTAQQKHQKTYKRRPFNDISPQDLNPPSTVCKVPEGIDHYSTNVIFYPFNAEGIRDYGWGCAWRSIQTCLASGGIDRPFESLFHLFGQEHHLKFLYSDKYPGKELHNDKPFAPYDLSSGWAEPFIGQLAFHFYGRDADLETVNGIPDSCNAPVEVFHNAPLSFDSFLERLIKHFKETDPLPVMIDNGNYAFCIIGIGQDEGKALLWLADPHIKPGAGGVKDLQGICGVYTMAINELGKQARCSLDNSDSDQLDLMFSTEYQGIAFDQMNWMVLFPRCNLIKLRN